ncbi:MAG: hypothetical protein WBM07_19485 [Chitinivibrionales bacterium]
MFDIFEIVCIVAVVVYALKDGKGKEKLWAIAPVGLYLLVTLLTIVILSFISGMIYGANNIKAAKSSPLISVFAIFDALVICGTCLWIVARIRHRKAFRAAESIEPVEDFEIK